MNMKMRLKILLLSMGITGLTVSFAFRNGNDDISSKSVIPSNTDTTNINKWIKIDSFNLEILPPSSGVQFYRDGIVFLSSSKYDEKTAENHISFGKPDAKYAVLKNKLLEDKQVFSLNIPFPYPCEALTFTKDYNTMYFTRFSKEDGVGKIYSAKYSSTDVRLGKWILDDSPLSFCTGKSIYTHPALSADGKLLVFASNRTGSIGGMDLYATIEKGGVWSDPVNLGDAINSTANELYPYLDSENNLYFSSDGSQGFGGYDIYVCKFKSNTWERPINLATPVNTIYDDVAFTIDKKDGKYGFYTIKQKSGLNAQQLCMISLSDVRADTLLKLSQYFTRPDISQMVILALEPAVQATDKASVTASASRSDKDIITYRVQFMTSFNPRTRPQITVGTKDYIVFEFLYSGAYRLCVGEFTSLTQAVDLQNLLKKNDYPRATVLAFKNNVLSLDPELLKLQPGAVQSVPVEEKKVVEVAPVSAVTTKAATTTNLPKEKLQPQPEVKKTEVVKPAAPAATQAATVNEKKDVVVYRVQILTNNTAKGSFKITVAGKVYDTFEYLYAGAYRTCVGGFSTLSQATELQKICRQSGHPQAFVVAFKNNIRSTDPALFK
jgi:hypothetical protein